MIKAIFFDYDGVMTTDKTGSWTICKYISKVTDVGFDKLLETYRKFNNDLLYGKTTHEKIWGKLCTELGKDIDIKHLYDSFIITPVNEPMYELVKKLKMSYKTGLITDNKKDRLNAVIKYQKLNELFDTIIISADIGSGKDNTEIFKKAVESIDANYEECIFIDNQEKNLIVPSKLGMNTVFYDLKKNDVDDLILNLEKLIKNVI
jgi:putative hydrolase of the HAD superfamily